MCRISSLRNLTPATNFCFCFHQTTFLSNNHSINFWDNLPRVAERTHILTSLHANHSSNLLCAIFTFLSLTSTRLGVNIQIPITFDPYEGRDHDNTTRGPKHPDDNTHETTVGNPRELMNRNRKSTRAHAVFPLVTARYQIWNITNASNNHICKQNREEAVAAAAGRARTQPTTTTHRIAAHHSSQPNSRAADMICRRRAVQSTPLTTSSS